MAAAFELLCRIASLSANVNNALASLTRASCILAKITGFILIRDGTTFWKTVSRHTTSVVLSFVLTAGRYTVSTCSGENILNSCILRSVLSRRVASPRLRLSSSLRTTHAAHPSHANHYNDSTYGSKKTNIYCPTIFCTT